MTSCVTQAGALPATNRTVLSTLSSQGRQWFLLAALMAGLGSVAPAFADELAVNINTAAPEELAEALSGVGIARAYRIVEYREAHGPFEVVEELSEVKGIGDATVEQNRSRIRLQ